MLCFDAGTPRNPLHSKADNSTAGTAKLLSRFIELLYPTVRAIALDSQHDILKYGENIRFVDQQLRPRMADHRQVTDFAA